MKTFTLYGLAAILLVGWTASALAQSLHGRVYALMTPEQWEIRREAHEAIRWSPAMQEARKNQTRQAYNSAWNGNGSHISLMYWLQQEDFREGLGISNEEYQGFLDIQRGIFLDTPRVKPIQDEIVKLAEETGSPFPEIATEETWQKFFELEVLREIMQDEERTWRWTNAIDTNLTPEQMQKVKEYQISTMSEADFVSPRMFEALDLSDEQKEQLNEIRKAMGPDVEKFMNKQADIQFKLTGKIQDALKGKLTGITDPQVRSRLWVEARENVLKSDPEFRREVEETRESGRKFTDNLKGEMFDVLTDEQWTRMVDLIDNPPDYVKRVITRMREWRKQQEATNASVGGWAPGSGSWRPGDPIPEGYRQERNRRRGFPREEE